MIPRWHIVLGLIFVSVLYFIAPETKLIYLGLVFFGSVFIDLDHYIQAVRKTGSWSLQRALDYYRKLGIQEEMEKKKGIRRRGDFHLFHTIEFHIFVGLLGLLWIGFFYLFLGMVFHSLTDLLSIGIEGRLYRREFFFSNWLAKRI